MTHSRKTDSGAGERATVIGMITNVALALVKLIAGVLGQSAALVADAVHSFSDLSTDVVTLLGLRLARRPADPSHPSGHGKLETLAATGIGVVLLLVAVHILWGGAERLYAFWLGTPIPQPHAAAVLVAVLSLAGKELLFRYTRAVAVRLDSRALLANAWHQRSDALSSLGAALGVGGAALFGGSWAVLDPLAAIVVGFCIVGAAVSILRGSIHELLDGAPPGAASEVEAALAAVAGANAPHAIRVRRVGGLHAVEAHLAVSSELSMLEVTAITVAAERAVRDRLGTKSIVTVQVEASES